MKKILVVEDDSRIRHLITLYLQRESWEVIEADDGQIGLDYIEGLEDLDLVVLDIMIPKIDGWTLCRRLKKKSPHIPVVLLTARNTDEDELFGFELGADEYITKPFNPNVVVARIKSLFKRSIAQHSLSLGYLSQEGGLSQCKELVVQSRSRMVSFKGQELELSPKEFDLLCYFLENIGVALSRERILNRVWGYDYEGGDRVVDTTVKRLRQKLENRYIATVRTIGYRFKEEK